MSSRPRTDRPRHLARAHHLADGSHGTPSAPGARRATLAGLDDTFDVEAAFAPDFDFDSAFDDLDAAPVPEAMSPARPVRNRVALAIAVSLAAIPLLVIDNLGATAETASPKAVDTSEVAAPAVIRPVRAQIVVDTTITTLAPVVVTTTVATTQAAVVAPPTTEAKVVVAPTSTAAPRPTTTTTDAPPRTTVPEAVAPSSKLGDPNDPASWDTMAECETSGNWSANTGNGYYGGLQFSQASWEKVGGSGRPDQASKATQIEMGKRLQAQQGWAAWPTCARKLGYIE